MLQLSFPSPPIIRQRIGRASTDHFAMLDSVQDLAAYAQAKQHRPHSDGGGAWSGGHTWEQSIEALAHGDLSGVAKSDALLAKMENYELATQRRTWIDDVAGAMPNVPAFIAGQPLSMRRRTKAGSAFAPIAIIADLTTSASIDADKIAHRGAAILALVRALASRRPVELYVCTGLDANQRRNASYVVARIDTAPLDLSIAAHALTHAGAPRNVFYGIARALHDCAGEWPYGPKQLSIAGMQAVFAPAMPHVAETLCLPGIHANDPSVTNPQQWLADQLAQYGAEEN